MAYRRTPQVMERRALRHAAIVNAAVKLIARRGMEQFEVDAVAVAAKVAVGTIYNFFATREELIEAVVRHIVENDLAAMRAAAEPAAGPVAKLAASVKALVELQQASRRLSVAMLEQPLYCATIVLELRNRMRAAAPHLRGADELPAVAALGAIRAVLASGSASAQGLTNIVLAIAGVPAVAVRIRVPA